ncbi:uncharacterized protein [Watersipora subatra]|uniref:uncharacterized protein isoform X2 n=1 Tax=Watersipora subatra TaxID=2589382 RepID=UPI00355C582B
MRILGSFHVIHIIIGVFLIEPITEISVKEKVLNKVVRRTASSAEVSSYRFTNDKAMQVYTVSSTPKDQVDEMKSIAVIPEVCFRREDDNHSTCILKSCLKLFRSHQVWLMMLNGAFWGGSSGSFLVFTNEFIVNKLGLTEDEAALGVSIIGDVLYVMHSLGTVRWCLHSELLRLCLWILSARSVSFVNGYESAGSGCSYSNGVTNSGVLDADRQSRIWNTYVWALCYCCCFRIAASHCSEKKSYKKLQYGRKSKKTLNIDSC